MLQQIKKNQDMLGPLYFNICLRCPKQLYYKNNCICNRDLHFPLSPRRDDSLNKLMKTSGL